MASAREVLQSAKQSMQSVTTKRDQASLIANEATQDRAIMNEVRMIGGALVAIVIIALVLTEVYDAVEIEETSPFHGIVEAAETTGVAAITLLVVGLLVLSASVIMRFMGGSFGR